MSKSKENNINKLGERLIKNIDLYDGPVMVDNGEIKFEKEVGATDLYKPKRKVQTWDIMKDAAKEKAKKGDYKELRELRKIERKQNFKPFVPKKSSIETPGLTKETKLDTYIPPKLIETPKKPIEQIIFEKAQQRLKLEQEAHDRQYGRGGIPELKRPR